MKRKIPVSKEMSLKAVANGGKIEIYSFFPVDRFDCDCHSVIHEWKEKLAGLSERGRKKAVSQQESITCPRSKAGMKRYQITCKNCGETLGYCWATDATLRDWCDFHYTTWTDGEQWYGCYTAHISPITQQLCLECTCGQDTRDFRANMTLPGSVAFNIEKENRVGREFGQQDSKFAVSPVKASVIPFRGEELI